MKALNLLALLSLLLSNLLLANENNSSLDDYISVNKNEQFNFDYQKMRQRILSLETLG